MKQSLSDLQTELECLSTTLNAVAYGITDSKDVDFTREGIQEILYTICRHIDRIAEDIGNFE